MGKAPKIYINKEIPHVDIPQVDLISLLFDNENGVAQPDTVLHVDAAYPDIKFTKTTLQSTFQRIAHGLRLHYGVGAKGHSKDVITVMSYGQVMVPAVYFGVVGAGGIYSAASPSSTVAELARTITIGKSNLVVCGTEHVDVVKQACQQSNVPLSRVLIMESSPHFSLKSLHGNVNAISHQELPFSRITNPTELKNSTVTILWSSGTTGLPKGVALSHLNLVAEAYILSYQPRQFAMKQLETDPDSYKPVEYRTLGHLPISHIAGLFGYMVAPTYNGGVVYWMRKYNWADLLKYVKQYQITAFYTVPSIYLRISKSPDVTDHFAHVEAASTGAAPMDAQLQTASNKRLGDGSNTFIGQTWGLSETTGAVTAPIKGDYDLTGCIGWILPNVELRMVDDDYNDVEPGQQGEMLIRSPLVMNGYFNNPDATRDAFHDFNDDGKGPWLCTGDIGVQRDGKFYIVDRKKELLKYKGLQIAPAEIENLLFTHPAVAEAAVVGVPAPDDPGTEWPRAYVVLANEVGRTTPSAKIGYVQTYPVSPELNFRASVQRATGHDSSKMDALDQTRFIYKKSGQSQIAPTLSSASSSASDASKQDTLMQTRYFDKSSSGSSASSTEALAQELKRYVADRLAPHKQLRGGVKFVDEIPKNAIGKFLRRELRARAKEEIKHERHELKAKL